MGFKLKYISLVGIAIFIGLLFTIDLKQLGGIFQNSNFIYLIVAFLITVFATIINFLRWRYIANSLGIAMTTKKAISLSFKSFFAENTPGRIGEPLLKAVYLKKYCNTPYSKALFSTLFHKFMDLWAAAVEAIFVVIILFYMFKINLFIIIPVVIIFIFVISIIFIFKIKKVSDFFSRILLFTIPKKYKEKIASEISYFFEGFRGVNKKVVFFCLIYDLIVVFFTGISFYFISLSINQNIPFYHLLMLVPLVTIAVGIPISVAGVGTREAIFVYYFSLIGISSEIGIFFGIMLFLFKIIMIIPGLLIPFFEKD